MLRITSSGTLDSAVFVPELLPKHGVAFIHGRVANLPQDDVVVAAVADVFRYGNDVIAALLRATPGRRADGPVALFRSRASASRAACRGGAIALGLLARVLRTGSAAALLSAGLLPATRRRRGTARGAGGGPLGDALVLGHVALFTGFAFLEERLVAGGARAATPCGVENVDLFLASAARSSTGNGFIEVSEGVLELFIKPSGSARTRFRRRPGQLLPHGNAPAGGAAGR